MHPLSIYIGEREPPGKVTAIQAVQEVCTLPGTTRNTQSQYNGPPYNSNAVLIPEDTQASTSVSGKDVDLLKRFPTKNTCISLADEWIGIGLGVKNKDTETHDFFPLNVGL
jgi:hypothetical protein